MKFCYVDESGYGNERILIMVGIAVDAQRMHITKKHWKSLLDILSRRINRPIAELHSRKFYRGNGIWRDLSAEERTALIEIIIDWLKKRKHDVFFSAIDKNLFENYNWQQGNFFPNQNQPRPWQLCALHLILSIQKSHQRQNVKGQIVFIFDNEEREEESFIEVISEPPEWTDSFYSKGKKQERLNCIVDIPFFASSKLIGLINVADLFSYLIRYYAELKEGYQEPRYEDEINKLTTWINKIKMTIVPDSFRWPAKGGCECANLFKPLAPRSLLKFK